MEKYRWMVQNFPADAERHPQFINLMCDLANSKAWVVYYRLPGKVMAVTWLKPAVA